MTQRAPTQQEIDTIRYLVSLQNDRNLSRQVDCIQALEFEVRTIVAVKLSQGVAPSSLQDGLAPNSARVVSSDDELSGELLLWIQAGVIDTIEYVWYSDVAPNQLPNASQLRT